MRKVSYTCVTLGGACKAVGIRWSNPPASSAVQDGKLLQGHNTERDHGQTGSPHEFVGDEQSSQHLCVNHLWQSTPCLENRQRLTHIRNEQIFHGSANKLHGTPFYVFKVNQRLVLLNGISCCRLDSCKFVHGVVIRLLLVISGVEQNPGPTIQQTIAKHDKKVEKRRKARSEAKAERVSKTLPDAWRGLKSRQKAIIRAASEWKHDLTAEGVEPNPGPVCRSCGENGHILNICPYRKTDSDKRCRNCGQVGHIRRTCPTRKPQVPRAVKRAKLLKCNVTGMPVSEALLNVPAAQIHTAPDKKSIIELAPSDDDDSDLQETVINSPYVVEAEDAEFHSSEETESDSETDVEDVDQPEPTRLNTVFSLPKTRSWLGDVIDLSQTMAKDSVNYAISTCLFFYTVITFVPMLAGHVLQDLMGTVRIETDHEDQPKIGKTTRSVYWDMESKASTKFLTRDFSSESDCTAIQRDLIPIARSEKLHNVAKRDTPGIIMRAYRNGRNQALRVRLNHAREKMVKYSFAKWVRLGWHMQLPKFSWYFKDSVSELKYLDTVTEVDVGLHPAAIVGSAVGSVLRSVVVPVVEELGRRLILTLIFRSVKQIVGPAKQIEYIQHGFILLIAALFMFRESQCSMSYKDIAKSFFRLSLHFFLGQIAIMRYALTVHISWNIVSRMFSWGLHLDSFDDLEDTNGRVFADVCTMEQGLPLTSTQDGFKQARGEPKCEPQFGANRFWGFSFAVPTVFRSCTCNEQVAITGRVGKKLPMHVSDETKRAVEEKWKQTIKNTTPFILNKIKAVRKPVHIRKWLASYPPKRRSDFIRAIDQEKDNVKLRAKSFIKRETAPKYVHNIKFKDPRFIQGCPVELSLLAGPFLRKLAKNTREGLNGGLYTDSEPITEQSIMSGNHIGYTCGLNSEQIGDMYTDAIRAIASIEGPDEVVIVEDDQSRFDLHLTKGPFAYLNSIYEKKLPKRISNALKRGMSRGTTCFGTKYQIPYTMQSGWPDTSIGDTLVNAAMKLEIHGIRRPWFSIICGDDSVTITSKREIRRLGGEEAIVKSYAQYGMEIDPPKIKAHPLDVEFCSGRFYPLNNGRYVLMPKPGRFLSKILVDIEKRKLQDQAVWLDSVINVIENYGLVDPLIGAVGKALRKQVPKPSNLTKRQSHIYQEMRYAREFNPVVARPESADYNSYYQHVYDFSDRDIQELILKLSNTKLHDLLDDLRLEQMFAVDVGL